MDYTQLFYELQQASLFDLYRLKSGINKILDQPDRITAIKRQLRIGQEVTYFAEDENRLVAAIVEDIQRTRLSVRNKDDGKLWIIRFYMVNIDNVDTDIHSQHGKLDRNQLKVGDTVGYYDRQQQERYGKVVRLNQKTATVNITTGETWRVAYSFLFNVMDGESGHVSDGGLLEGIVVESKEPDRSLNLESIPAQDHSIPKVQSPFQTTSSTSGSVSSPSQKAGRNAPCPCGSGRKYKMCCLKN